MLVCDICYATIYEQYMKQHLAWHDKANILFATLLRTERRDRKNITDNRNRLDVMDDNAKQAD